MFLIDLQIRLLRHIVLHRQGRAIAILTAKLSVPRRLSHPSHLTRAPNWHGFSSASETCKL